MLKKLKENHPSVYSFLKNLIRALEVFLTVYGSYYVYKNWTKNEKIELILKLKDNSDQMVAEGITIKINGKGYPVPDGNNASIFIPNNEQDIIFIEFDGNENYYGFAMPKKISIDLNLGKIFLPTIILEKREKNE